MFPFTLPLGGALAFLLLLYFGEGKAQVIDDMRQWIGERAGFQTITIATYFAAFMVSSCGGGQLESSGTELTAAPPRRARAHAVDDEQAPGALGASA